MRVTTWTKALTTAARSPATVAVGRVEADRRQRDGDAEIGRAQREAAENPGLCGGSLDR